LAAIDFGADVFDVAGLPVIHGEVRRLIKVLNGLKSQHRQSVDKFTVELAEVERSHKRWQTWRQYIEQSTTFEGEERDDLMTEARLKRAREISTRPCLRRN